MRTDILRAVGGFRAGMRFSEHTDLALRLGGWVSNHQIRVTHTDTPLVTMHRDDRPYNPALQYESAMLLLEEDAGHLRRSPALHSTYLGIAGVAAARLGRHPESRRLLVRAIRVYPRTAKHYLRLLREVTLRR